MTRDRQPPFDLLLFDLGGVFVDHDNELLYRRLVSRCREGTTREAVKALFAEERWGTGAPISELHQVFRHDLGYALDWSAFKVDWCCHFELIESMIALLHALEIHNRVALFSNTNAEHWRFVLELSGGRLGAFECYLSHEIGLAKPSLAAFRHVAAAAGIDPARSIFFDDVLENVEGARRAGFQAEVFTDEAALRALLAERGVAIG